MPRIVRVVALVLAAILSSACSSATPAASSREIDLDGIPSKGIAYDFGSVWAGASDKGDVLRIDPTNDTVLSRIKIGDPAKQSSRARNYHGVPIVVATGFGSVWAAGADEALTRIDPNTLDIKTFPIAIVGTAMTIADDGVWVASYDDGALVRFDPKTNTVGTTIRGQGSLLGIAAASGFIWAVNRSGHELVRFDPRTGAATGHVPIERNPQYVVAGAGALWVSRETPRAIQRVDPGQLTVTTTYPAEEAWGVGGGLLFADDGLWLGNLARIDPATGKVRAKATAPAGQEQTGIAVGGGSVWIVEDTKIRQVPLALVR